MANETLSSVSAATLSANTTLSQATSSANTTFGQIGSAATEDTDSLLKNAIQAMESAGISGRFGINIDQIPTMQAAISAYINDVNTALEKLNASNANDAFGPKIGEAMEVFVKNVKYSVQQLTGNLAAFKADLAQVKEAYENKASSASAAINTTAEELKGTASSWTYSGAGSSSN